MNRSPQVNTFLRAIPDFAKGRLNFSRVRLNAQGDCQAVPIPGICLGLVNQSLSDGEAQKVGIILQPKFLHDAVLVECDGARGNI